MRMRSEIEASGVYKWIQTRILLYNSGGADRVRPSVPVFSNNLIKHKKIFIRDFGTVVALGNGGHRGRVPTVRGALTQDRELAGRGP